MSQPSPPTATVRRPQSGFPSAASPRRAPKGRFSSPFFRVGLPFLAFVSVASYILSRFLDDQFAQQRKQQQWTAVEKKIAPTITASGEQQQPPKPFDLTAEYEKTMSQIDLSTFDNIRVPRPEQIAERTKQNRAAAALTQQQMPAAAQPQLTSRQ